jgi:hypothetical protein
VEANVLAAGRISGRSLYGRQAKEKKAAPASNTKERTSSQDGQASEGEKYMGLGTEPSASVSGDLAAVNSDAMAEEQKKERTSR